MPLAPLGCGCQFHIKPSRRKTWGEHSTDGWYIGASPEHYRTHIVFVKATKHLQLSDTVYFKHKYITQPTITPEDRIVHAYQDLTLAIQGFQSSKGGASMEALQRLQEALSPGSTRFVPPQASQQQEQQAPRVQFDNRVPELTLYDPDPRVPMATQLLSLRTV